MGEVGHRCDDPEPDLGCLDSSNELAAGEVKIQEGYENEQCWLQASEEGRVLWVGEEGLGDSYDDLQNDLVPTWGDQVPTSPLLLGWLDMLSDSRTGSTPLEAWWWWRVGKRMARGGRA